MLLVVVVIFIGYLCLQLLHRLFALQLHHLLFVIVLFFLLESVFYSKFTWTWTGGNIYLLFFSLSLYPCWTHWARTTSSFLFHLQFRYFFCAVTFFEHTQWTSAKPKRMREREKTTNKWNLHINWIQTNER